MGDLIESTTGPQIKVVVEAASDLPSAKAELNQLEMALLNLAVNARCHASWRNTAHLGNGRVNRRKSSLWPFAG